VLVAGAAALVLALIGGVGVWLAIGDDDGGSDQGGGPTESPRSGGEDVGVPEQSLLVGVTEDSGTSRIITIDVTTGESEVLVEGGRDAVLPAISPDRRTVAYLERDEDGSTRPMLLDVDSGEQRRLLAHPDSPCRYSSRPGWSIAGDRLALVCQDRGGDARGLYVVDLDGAALQEVETDGDAGGSPTWTSESSLVYIRSGDTDEDPTTLWEADLETGESTPLTDGTAGFDSHPDWSEEAGLLLFSRHPTSDFYGALLVREPDGDIRTLTEDGESVAHPAWSPDGSEVVVTVREADREVIMVSPLDRSSGAPTEVPDVPGDPGPPAWGSR
jgi:Tol biopolymer transport system component